MRRLLLLLCFMAGIGYAQGQNYTVSGTVQSAQNKETLPGASVLLIRVADSVKTATGTDKDGNFRFSAVKPGAYSVLINYIGHKSFSRAVTVQNGSVNLGHLMLEEASTTIKEIEVVGQIPLGTQKGDTTVFNAAAFKVADDASAEDLVTKLPGVTIVDGKVQAQGEEVRQVLVDGKRFFGEDANTALRNLPAEIIENIEIFDKRSDQSEFSGFDDGNRAKTINIVTKQNRRKGQFGKVAAGIGPDEKYMAGTSLNIFNGNRRFTVNGLTNNINMQDFSVGEAPGGGMRGRRGGGGGGGGGVGSGISNTNNLALNYSDQWGKKIETSGTYTYNNVFNRNESSMFRDYFRSRTWYNQQTGSSSINNSRNESHNFNFRLDYRINETNRLLITPRVSISNNRSFSSSQGLSVYDSIPTNDTYDTKFINRTNRNTNNADSYSYNIGNNINYSHRFAKPGRTISASLNTSMSVNDGNNYRIQDIENFIRPDKSVNLDQHIKTDRDGFNWRGNVSLSERVGEKARVQAEYNISNRFDTSDRLAYDWVPGTTDNGIATGSYTDRNDRLSNAFESQYMTQQAKTSYQYNSEKLRFQVEGLYQMAHLQNEQEFPKPYQLDRTFHNVMPNAQVEYKFTKTKNLQFDYRTNTDAPSISQLQEVVDNSSPLRFSTGNTDLEQAYQNSANIRYRSFNTETNRVFSFFVTASKTDKFITNSTVELDSIPVPDLLRGMEILPGARFTRPVNLDGNWSARSFISYGQPLGFIKSNVNLTGSVGYNRTPGLINNDHFFTNTTNYRLGISLSSNISQNVDFNVSTSSSYNDVMSTRQQTQNNNFFNQSTQLRANLRWKGLVYRTELNHQLNKGLSTDFNTSFTLLNMSMSKKVLKNQRGEVSLSVNDLLGQNQSVVRTVNTDNVQDSRSTVLQRFYMLTFSYNIRNFAGGAMPGGRGSGERGERAPGERGNYRGGEGGGFERQGGGRNRN